MTAKEVCREVICLLKGGERWTKGTLFRKADESFAYGANEADKFCLIGAALKVTGETSSGQDQTAAFLQLIRPYLGKVDKRRTGRCIATWNDKVERTFDEVETALGKALVAANKKPKAV